MDKAHLENLKKDLHHLSDSWKRVQVESMLVDDREFLQSFASDIKQLDADLQEAEKVPEFKEPSELIEHLLRTPWGAPFICETPLLDAANEYKKEMSESNLRKILTEFLHYHNEIDEQLFNCIEEIEKKLTD